MMSDEYVPDELFLDKAGLPLSQEDVLGLLPVRPALNKGFGLLQSTSWDSQFRRNALRWETAPEIAEYLQSTSRGAFWDIPLPLGFSLPIANLWGGNDPAPLQVGGERPTWRQQLDAVYHGQRTDNGFNLFGWEVKLPEWAGGILRTHTSADLVFKYRNLSPGLSRDVVRTELNFIHPGYPALIDAEQPRFRVMEIHEPPSLAQQRYESAVPAFSFDSVDSFTGVLDGFSQSIPAQSKSRRSRTHDDEGCLGRYDGQVW